MMKIICVVFFVLVLLGCSRRNPPEAVQVPAIIFDTDFGPDYDDVGALAFLHAMADSGKIRILATIASNRNELVGPSLEIVNRYYGRADLPMGAPKSTGVSLGAFQHWPDSLIAKYEHDIVRTSDLPDAVATYRKVLNGQPDSSVTIITVGFLTNMADLLRSKPDSISRLTGQELVAKKVRKLISMAGGFPSFNEYNIKMDALSAKYTYENWPGEVIFTGWEIGARVLTGLRLVSDGHEGPVKDVFRISIPLAAEDSAGRKSWDETAALIGVYGTNGFFEMVPGRIVVQEDGSNTWINDIRGPHSYVKLVMPPEAMARFIEDRMMHIPGRD